jgi:aromatic ring-opening dioxygenase catalytic subunit (LigB family)
MMTNPASVRMPTFFLPHGGGPCFFMDWTPPDTWTRLRIFLERLAKTLPERPKAIVVVSAHWLAQTFTVGATGTPGMIFDYFGFPDHIYALRFDAPGQPVLAARVVDRLRNVGLDEQQTPRRITADGGDRSGPAPATPHHGHGRVHAAVARRHSS